MAGFDATFRFSVEDHDLVVAMVAASRRRCPPLWVRWHSKIERTGRGYCRMDGNGFQIDLCLERLRRDLPTIAEATPSARHSPAQRRRLANGFVDILCRYRVSLYDRHWTEDGPEYVPLLRRVRTTDVWPVHSLWPGDQHPELVHRLTVTEGIVASWLLGEAAPEVVLEELHSASELMMKHLLRKNRAPAFADLVRQTEKAGHGLDGLRVYYAPEHSSEALDRSSDLLISLKDCRREVKHRGAATAHVWLDVHAWPAAFVLEHLAERLQAT